MFFNRFKPLLSQFTILAILSIGSMIIDSRSSVFTLVKQYISVVAEPFYSVAAFPEQASVWLEKWFTDRQRLQESINKVALENAILKVKIQEIQSDIDRFKNIDELSQSATKFAQKMILGKIIEASIERNSQKMIVNKGQYDQVYLGQPVIDDTGILGQVTELSVTYSIVTLLTDASQSTPVLIKRNRLRALLNGTGHVNRLLIKYLGTEADVKVGDQLVSSGIGSRYPSGYPIAQVTEVVKDDNEAFLHILATPLAKISHGERVLLIWPMIEDRSKISNIGVPSESTSTPMPRLK